MAKETIDSLLKNLCDAEARATFLRVHERDQRQTALVRVRIGDGVNYFEFYLGQAAGGKAVADDVYVYLSGQVLSSILREAVVSASSSIQQAQRFRSVIEELQKNPAQGLVSVASLPKAMRDLKSTQILVVMAAGEIDEATYLKALEAFRAKFPKDPALDLMLVDYFLLNKDYDKTLASLERLATAVGGDAFLDYLMAGTLTTAKSDWPRAVALAEQAIAKEPGDQEYYYVLLEAQIGAELYPAALESMETVLAKFQVYFDTESLPELMSEPSKLTELPGWPAYRAAYEALNAAAVIE